MQGSAPSEVVGWTVDGMFVLLIGLPEPWMPCSGNDKLRFECWLSGFSESHLG